MAHSRVIARAVPMGPVLGTAEKHRPTDTSRGRLSPPRAWWRKGSVCLRRVCKPFGCRMKYFSCLLGLLLAILLSACGGSGGSGGGAGSGGVGTPSALSYSTSAPVYTVGVAITTNSPSSSGGAVTSYAVSPALPAGLSLNTVTGVISGTPSSASAATNYTVTASNAGGSATTTLSISAATQATGSGKTITAASCSYADVSSAITSAAIGDTVNVPAGNCTWSSTLLINKGISLIGGNGGTTKITASLGAGYDASNFIIDINPTDYNANDLIRLSGFTLDANNNGSILKLGQFDKRPPFNVPTKIRVDHNILQNANLVGGYGIWNFCTLYGVVDNNTITNVAYPIKNDTQSLETWNTTSPQNNFVSGSNNYIYYEDNTLHEIAYPGGSDGLLVEQQFSGRYAFRYNQIVMHAVSYSLFENHGHQGVGPGNSGSTMGSGFGVELYGNQVLTNGYGVTFFKTRGGRSFVFNNSVDNGFDINAYDGSMTTCAQTYVREQTIYDNYFWGSRTGLTGAFAGVSADNSYNITCDGRSNIPTLGRDVVTDTSSPGVTAGTLANRPAICTENQGYWATNQSTTNLAGMIGVNPITAIAGTLYKCTKANVWTAIYTPFVYPHPLRSGN